MKLSQRIIIGLRRLGNKTLVSEDCFNSLLKVASIVLTEQSKLPVSLFNEINISKPDIVKESFASLLILLVESSRHDLDSNTLVSTLENYNLNLPRLEAIVDIYEKHKSRCQLSLEKIGSLYPRIQGVKWRLDFCIKSSSLEHESHPIYFIQIVTEVVRRKNLLEEIVEEKKYIFTCSLQQLQELVAKLRDATRLIQSIANTK